MVIDDFDVMDIGVMPCKTNTPLCIYYNAVLSFAISMQGFEMIAWWYS